MIVEDKLHNCNNCEQQNNVFEWEIKQMERITLKLTWSTGFAFKNDFISIYIVISLSIVSAPWHDITCHAILLHVLTAIYLTL